MLGALIKEHDIKKAQRLKEAAQVRADAVGAISDLNRELLHAVNDGAAKVHENQKKLDQEARALQAQTAEFAKQTKKWLDLFASFDAGIKDLGDVHAWSEQVETDLNTIATSLEYVQNNDTADAQ